MVSLCANVNSITQAIYSLLFFRPIPLQTSVNMFSPVLSNYYFFFL